MLFYILIIVCFVSSVWLAWDSFADTKKSPVIKKITGFLKAFLISLAGTGTIALLVFGILVALFSVGAGDKRVTVNVEKYNIAEKSRIDNSGSYLTFTAVKEDSTLEAQKILYDSLSLKNLDEGNVVIVVIEDQYHQWLAPWNLNTFRHVILV